MLMYLEKEDPHLWVKKLFAIVMIAVFSFGLLGMVVIKIKEAKVNFSSTEDIQINLTTVGQNSLIAISNPADPIKTKKVKASNGKISIEVGPIPVFIEEESIQDNSSISRCRHPR